MREEIDFDEHVSVTYSYCSRTPRAVLTFSITHTEANTTDRARITNKSIIFGASL